MSEENSLPIGFYNLGVGYLDVARRAADSDDDWLFHDPFEFLIAHGLELIFKADRRRELPMEDVRRQYGHSLPNLFNDLSVDFRNKFEVGDELKFLVAHLDGGHSGPKWRNRYLETGYRENVPTLSSMLSIVSPFNLVDRRWLSNHFVGRIA
ncbi:hypothetical protein N6H05_01945 [Sphingobium sp. WTD-1]|uniref:hypothetical protein n=1 Tax=Sphingobium sp. WTD-1 TaxID=2979467 RepID=UPI0024DE9B1A|nr:hypothetical protein [Sphingobium sp. WTD-1]WIA56613.1 hypothetical protein N6H05_01945 [Sphingobium sp. WTD-1]